MKAKLSTVPDRRAESAVEVLKEALEENYQSVIVFGFSKDGKVHTMISEGCSRVMCIGALEVAKIELWG